jgi:membrane protein DedA with SNARE-associated domain
MDPTAVMALILQYRYPILIPAALVWGLLVCMVAGVAIRLGYLDFWIAYPCLMLGELLGDMIWYWIGYAWGGRFARRFGKYVGITPDNVENAMYLFRKYDRRILFTTKITTGFGLAIPILFTAGMTRMSFWRYISTNFFGQMFWTGGLIAIGYFFGDVYLNVSTVYEKIVSLVLFLVFFLCFIGFIRYVGKRLRKHYGFT